jgi:hypothetical protein
VRPGNVVTGWWTLADAVELRAFERGPEKCRFETKRCLPQGLNHEWPPHGQLFGIAYATFFTESRRHLARGAQLNRPFVEARRILSHLRHD